MSKSQTKELESGAVSIRDLLWFEEFVEARKNDPRLSAAKFAEERGVASSVVQKSRQKLEKYFQELLLRRKGKRPPPRSGQKATGHPDYSDEDLMLGAMPFDWEATSEPTETGIVIASLAALVRQQLDLILPREGSFLGKPQTTRSIHHLLAIHQEVMARTEALVVEYSKLWDPPFDDEETPSQIPSWGTRAKAPSSSTLGRRQLKVR